MQRFASLFAATAAIAGMVAAYLFLQLRAEHLRSTRLQERIAQLEFAQLAKQASVSVAPVVTGTQPARAASAQPAEAANPTLQTVRAAEVPRVNASRANLANLMKDPVFRAAQLEQRRIQLQRSYADLAKELNLTPAQVDALFDLMAGQQLARISEPAVLAANGQANDEASRRALRNALEESRRAQDAEIATLLGDSKYQEFKEYQETMGARQRVTHLRSQLAAQGQLLTEEQTKPLVTAMAAEQKLRDQQMAGRERPTQGDARAQMAFQEQALKSSEESNRRLLRAAAAHLDAGQVTALEALLEQELAMSRAALRVQQARLEAQGRVGAQ
jgi:hypothetical protein